MEPFLGEIIMFGGNFAPRGWALCDGQLLPIAQNTALFSILGTTYGGDGRTTFGLPELRGRAPIHAGHGPGLSDVRLGQKGGLETVTLTQAQMPAHNHSAITQAAANPGRGTVTTTPTGAYLAEGGSYAPSKDVQMATDGITVGNTGNSAAHENRPPYQAVNYIIALQGTFPSRN